MMTVVQSTRQAVRSHLRETVDMLGRVVQDLNSLSDVYGAESVTAVTDAARQLQSHTQMAAASAFRACTIILDRMTDIEAKERGVTALE
jgi:hypothetical protein